MIQLLNVIGILSSSVGTVVLFYYGTPFRTLNGGMDVYHSSDPKPEEIEKDRIYEIYSHVGLYLLILGAIFQIAATIWPT